MNNFSRRDFARIAFAAIPAQILLGKPNSNIGGVQLGLNVPYSYHGLPGTADDILKYTTGLGISAVELRSQPVEAYCGAPHSDKIGALKDDSAIAELAAWRLAAPMAKFKEFRKKYEDAGIAIQIVKFDAVDKMKDEVADYAFELAHALGAKAISCEIPLSKTEWFGKFATKHKMMVGYHGHTNVTSPEAFAKPESWEKAMSFSKYNGINLDLGHFTAANNTSPIPFLEKYVDRVTHVHVKDRKFNNGPNVPLGQGDTPIKEVLQLMKAKKYKFQATIEFEYKVPDGSDVLKEIGKCIDYCKSCLA